MPDDETKSIPELRGEVAVGRSPREMHQGLQPGTKVGRYLVLYRLGRGGMGEVYAAYDPELDRKVAIKFLRREIESRRARELQRREAKAMARLRHRNLVTVHDVGEHERRTFIAMELVDGMTLRRWLAAGVRSWRQVVAVFLQAGRGLEAAHAADIVHRDFKPSNVMVTEDGQAWVMDFGLAGADQEPSRDQAGGTPGTPAYLAPERAAGAAGDALSDQFSFCVALYQALHGTRPFDAPPQSSRRGSASGTAPAAGGDGADAAESARVPGWLRKALLRGLDREPGERFAGMGELLAALDPGRRRSRERRLMATAGLILGALAVAWTASQSRTAPCGDASPRLAGVWDAGRRQAVREAFENADATLGTDTFARVAGALDDYTGRWLEMHREACEATRVRGEQSERMLDLRMVCLDGRLAEVGALTRVLADADSRVLLEAVSSTRQLSSLRGCADRSALDGLTLPPAEPRARAQIERSRDVVEEQLVRIRTYQPVDESALEEAIAVARRLGYAPLESRALYIRGIHQVYNTEELDAAAESYHQSLVAAIAGDDRSQQTRIYSQLMFLKGYLQRETEEARRWQQLAEAALRALGPGHDEDALVAESLAAMFAWANGDFEAAYERRRRAVEHGERLWGPDDPQLGEPLTDFAVTALELGRVEEAAVLLERAAILNERGYGPNHPILGRTLHNLASLHGDRGDYTQGLQLVRRAREIVESLYDDHRDLTFPLLLEAELLIKLDRPGEALPIAERALTLARDGFGETHPITASALDNLGDVALLEDRPGAALTLFARARKMRQDLPAEHPEKIRNLINLGRAELDNARPEVAGGLLEEARLLTAEAVLGEHDRLLLRLALGRAYLRDLERARPVLESALGAGRGTTDPALVAEARFALARSLGSGEATRALELARQALDGLSNGGSPRTRSLRAEVEEWLAARTRGS